MSLDLCLQVSMALYTLLITALYGVTTLAQSSTTADASTATDLPILSELGDVNATYRLHGYEGCSANQIDQIKSGFSDMVIMVMSKDGIIPKYPAINWNSAVAQEFWGPAERNLNYREQIQSKVQGGSVYTQYADINADNLNRLAAVTYQYRLNPFARWLHVRCDDPENACSPKECVSQGKYRTAYNIKLDPHINFCNGYFRQKTLTDALMGGDWTNALAYFNQGKCDMLWHCRHYKLMFPSFCLGTRAHACQRYWSCR